MRQWRRVCVRTLATVTAVGLAGWALLPKPPLLDGVAFSRRVFDRNGELLRMTLTPDEKYRIYVPLDAISPRMIEATLRFEDRHFSAHAGVNPAALGRAAWRWMASGNTHGGGASTVTMQVARLRFGLNTRTAAGKFRQIVRAVEIERHYTKKQILEAYLNLAPYGRNIEGVGAAAEIYWGKSPARLTLPESVALSVIPQSPSQRALRLNDVSESAANAQRRLARNLQSDVADFTPLGKSRVPFLAPHFTQLVLRQNNSAGDLITTLDLDAQRSVERTIARYLKTKESIGIRNAAAMLIDSQTMEVLAQVGSANFYDEKIDGEVDGTRSARSPGSTLKPFVYALAMQQGLIHPLSVVNDVPRSFGGYNPENFERDFAGPLKACDALARSRNLPAVDLASQLVRPSLYEFLKSSAVALPRPEKYYGLALPLGGAEVKMEDLIRLYAMLANNGELRQLRRIQMLGSTGLRPAGFGVLAKSNFSEASRVARDDPFQWKFPPAGCRRQQAGGPCYPESDMREEAPKRLLSPEAAFLTLEMLRQPWLANDTGEVFWKTGTSHGFHDAWCIAVFDHYVLAVWLGNFDGSSNPALVGRSCAAPLLFQIVNALRFREPASRTVRLPPSDANLRQVEFCAVSGQLPTAACRHRLTGWFIPGVSPIAECELHRPVVVDCDDGLQSGSREIVYEFWSTDLLTLFQRAGLPRQLPPGLRGDSAVERISRGGRAPVITSPETKVRYRFRAGDSNTSHLTLTARADTDVRTIFWFADKSFIGASKPDEACLWQPSGTTATITALDDHGRSASCAVAFEWSG